MKASFFHNVVFSPSTSPKRNTRFSHYESVCFLNDTFFQIFLQYHIRYCFHGGTQFSPVFSWWFCDCFWAFSGLFLVSKLPNQLCCTKLSLCEECASLSGRVGVSRCGVAVRALPRSPCQCSRSVASRARHSAVCSAPTSFWRASCPATSCHSVLLVLMWCWYDTSRDCK